MALKQTTTRRVTMTAAAWLVAFLIFFPILWMFLTSFKTEGDAYAIPAEIPLLSLDHRELRRGAVALGLFPACLSIRSCFRSDRMSPA